MSNDAFKAGRNPEPFNCTRPLAPFREFASVAVKVPLPVTGLPETVSIELGNDNPTEVTVPLPVEQLPDTHAPKALPTRH